MEKPTSETRIALDALDEVWRGEAARGLRMRGVDLQSDTESMSDAALLAANSAVARASRALDAVHTRLAAEIARRSRAELGKDGLARKAGHRTPAKLIAATTGGHPGDAARLIQVAEATQQRMLFSGERAPARCPHVAVAVAAGSLSVAAAAAITGMLTKLAVRVDSARLNEAERTIVAQAPQLSLDELQMVLRRAEAYLDPDGLEPMVADLRQERALRITEDRSGMTVITARLDPETAAPIRAAIEAIVTHQLRVTRGHNAPGAADDGREPSEHEVLEGSELISNAGAGEAALDDTAPTREKGTPTPVAEETRSIPQLHADALAVICRHVLGCDEAALPLASTTVVVRMSLADLQNGSGVATIDGIVQPIDAGTARRMAAQGEVIPCVLGGDSEILDFGRARRLFSRAQRLALVERDGGCAFCGLDPKYTEAHHLRWWDRDAGSTDLQNGLLLCTACHHRIHDDQWVVRIDPPPSGDATGGTVWFVPPPHIDPHRTPRLGGRRRLDPATWNLAA